MGISLGEYDAERFPGNFYQGRIVRLDRGRGWGVVCSETGRQLVFEFPFVTVLDAAPGARAGMELLELGSSVGFDVARTSHGMRVSTIKIFGRPSATPPPDGAESESK